jgi:DNA-binding GntR family transcriptional regulator
MLPDAVEELEQRQEEFKNAVLNGNPMEIAETDEAYHDVIYKGTCNDRLIQMINNLREQMYRYRLEYIKDEDKRQILLLEHDHILEAVRRRKVEEAKEAMREHIDNQEITVSKNIKEQE